ncbi:MAG: LptF/LptG family permease [Candidatus Omnitrophica bacterium]|nr:LptF/LptG family permease [Candidatus Omnitrophota bacterium]
MKIIDKYLVKGFLGPFIWCLMLFTVMAVIIDVFSFIDDIVKFGIPLTSIIAFYVYYTPTIFIQVTPMAALLSTIYVLSNLNKNNEIIAMKSSGISLWRILAPILLIGVIVSIVTFVVNDRIIPVSSKISNYIRREELEKKQNAGEKKIIESVAIYGSGNKILFARNYDTENKILNDVIIHQHDKKESLISKITAQRGEWTGDTWKFYKVIVWKIDNAGRILGEPLFFEEKEISLKEKPADFANHEWRSDYMSYRELRDYINNFQGAGTKLMKTLLVDLHYKISFCFINLIIILLGAPFALITTRGGVLVGIGMSIAIGLSYYAFIAISLAFGKAGLLPPIVAAWLGNVLFTGLGIHLINKRS